MKSVSTSSDASAVSSSTRARPGKSLRGSNATVTNIGVYRKGATEQAQSPAPVVKSGAPLADQKTSKSNHGAQGFLRSVNRSQVALGIAACLCITATLAAASWPRLTDTDEARALKSIQEEIDVASSVQKPDSIAPVSSTAENKTPVIPEVKQPAEVAPLTAEDEKLAETYLTEIRHLRTENVELTHEVKVLTDESIELNQELLALELAEAARIRVVYNFVNDPSEAPADDYFNDNNSYYINSGDQQDAWSINNGGDSQFEQELQYDQNYQNEQQNYQSEQYYQEPERPFDQSYQDAQYNQQLQNQQFPDAQFNQQVPQDPDYQYDTGYVFDYDEEVYEEDYIQDEYIQQ